MKAHSVILVVILALPIALSQNRPAPLSDRPDTPFKIANLAGAPHGRPAIVVKDRIYDLQRANTLVARQSGLPALELPDTTLGLIEQYDRLKARLYQIANYLSTRTVDFAQAPQQAKFLAPILYPWNLLAVAINYREHGAEMDRPLDADYVKDTPFVFAKSPKAGIIGPGEPVIIPEGRDRIDWEIELAVIIRKRAKNVRKEQAGDYIFGYGLILDMSDRGGMPRKNPLFNADWFTTKSRDRFAPMAAYIVPGEFLKNHGKLNLKLSVNGQVMQDFNTEHMVHNVEDLVQFISSIQTLEPGDVIATGTPPGVGSGRNPPIFLKRGDMITAEIEGIGSIRTPVQ